MRRLDPLRASGRGASVPLVAWTRGDLIARRLGTSVGLVSWFQGRLRTRHQATDVSRDRGLLVSRDRQGPAMLGPKCLEAKGSRCRGMLAASGRLNNRPSLDR